MTGERKHAGLIRKYGLNMSRQAFREKAADIGFVKVCHAGVQEMSVNEGGLTRDSTARCQRNRNEYRRAWKCGRGLKSKVSSLASQPEGKKLFAGNFTFFVDLNPVHYYLSSQLKLRINLLGIQSQLHSDVALFNLMNPKQQTLSLTPRKTQPGQIPATE